MLCGHVEIALHLVRSGDVANAIHDFEFGPGFVSAAGLDGNWRLTNSGEGDQGSVSLHVASSVSCLSDQVLTELKCQLELCG